MVRGGTRTARQDGAAAVEFALVAPLIIILLFGIVSYGYMLSFRQAISQGAAEGARAAAVAPGAYSTAQLQAAALDAVQQALDNYGTTCGSAALTCTVTIGNCPSNAAKQCATVTIDYLYDAHPLVPQFPGIPLPEHLAYTAVAEVS
jgi:Flp pilus assembly protein TadG